MHLTYIWIVSHLSAKNYQNWWKFDEVLTKTNLLSFFGTWCRKGGSKSVFFVFLRILKRFIVAPAVYPHFFEFLCVDIVTTEEYVSRPRRQEWNSGQQATRSGI